MKNTKINNNDNDNPNIEGENHNTDNNNIDDDINEVENLKRRVQEQMKRAYFDIITCDIDNNDFDSTFAILEEIRARICLVVPKRVDLHEDMHEHLDVDHFRTMVKHNAFDITMIKNIMNFIIDKIKQLGSESDEPWNEIWRTQMHVRFERGEKLSTILPIFFKEALYRIEKIEYEIGLFKKSILYKTLMEHREQNSN